MQDAHDRQPKPKLKAPLKKPRPLKGLRAIHKTPKEVGWVLINGKHRKLG